MRPGEIGIADRKGADARVAVDNLAWQDRDVREQVCQRTKDVVALFLGACGATRLVHPKVGRSGQNPTQIGKHDADAAIAVFEIDHVAVQGRHQVRIVEDQV